MNLLSKETLIGVVIGFALGAFLPTKFNPLTYLK